MSQNPGEESQNPYAASSQVDTSPQQPIQYQQPSSASGIIPYNNKQALIAYYLGIFSLIPCFGLILAIPAFILGIIGWQNYRRNPEVKGNVHAWIGIVMGALCTLIWGGATLAFVVSLLGASF